MLSSKSIRMLELLDKKVMNCSKFQCGLYLNGIQKPFWTPNSRFAIINEAPSYNDIRRQIPFTGAAGKILTDELLEVGLQAKDFLILNTVQCRSNHAKPIEQQMLCCQEYIRKYIKIIRPEKILCLGNYAKYFFTDRLGGIMSDRGRFRDFTLDGSNEKYPVLFTFHPAYCIYNAEEGLPLLKEDIRLFKEKESYRNSDWFLTEEEFEI